MLHPVGPLPAGVYWRRRAVVLRVILSVLGGAGWGGWLLWTGPAGASTWTAASTRDSAPGVSRLDRVVPSVADVRTPTPPAASPSSSAAPSPRTACDDDMIGLAVRAPATVAVGSKPTLELVVTNTSPAPCRRVLDKGLQEIVLLDSAGTRIWGSNDCFPEQTDDTRTLRPGESVAFPVLWSGLTSEPTCTAPRTPPGPGSYVLRGRLDTKTSGDSPVEIG